jgi:hypothetical protein
MARFAPRSARWWQPLLPAGAWLFASRMALAAARRLMHARPRWRAGVIAGLRLSSGLSRAGFNSWCFWKGKWR